LDGFPYSYHFRFDKGTLALTGVVGLIVLRGLDWGGFGNDENNGHEIMIIILVIIIIINVNF